MSRVGNADRWRSASGEAIAEAALVFPLLIMVALGLIQFTLFVHAENVVTGAVQDGARVGAESDRSVGDGLSDTQAILQAGLGPTASRIAVQGSDDGEVVTIAASGGLPTIIPWVATVTLPLHAQATVSKERFRAGPNG
jgi:Flp pilus assembly protein TadG